MIYLQNRVMNTENPPKLEEILKEVDNGFDNNGKVEKQQDPNQMLNMVKKLNAQFGGHLPK